MTTPEQLQAKFEDQQRQIYELSADVRVLQANFATHQSETDFTLARYRNWISGGAAIILLGGLIASLTTLYDAYTTF